MLGNVNDACVSASRSRLYRNIEVYGIYVQESKDLNCEATQQARETQITLNQWPADTMTEDRYNLKH